MGQITLSNVSKAYYTSRKKDEARIVLKDVNIDIEKGEFVSLIGPSGCGKTTMLNLIAGFEGPTLGEVRFNGNPIEGTSPERGVVFQEFSLLPWFSVLSNINLALECKNVPEKERSAISMKALETVGMENFADYRPNLLSGGMKQRVAIARALANTPELLLADEPTAALDSVMGRKVMELLKQVAHEHNTGVLVVTHDHRAIDVFDRIYVMEDGKIKAQ